MSGPLRKVIILGAGASVPAGAPVMRDFLDRARYIRRHLLSDRDEIRAFDSVLESLRDMASIYEKAYLDLNNLEEVFGAIEMAQLIGKLADRSPEEIAQLRNDFTLMVARTLQLSITFPNMDATKQPPAAGPLATTIQKAIKRGIGVSVISFNYDLLMEIALRGAGLAHYYGLIEDQPENPRVIPLLKLHGSVNWYFCDRCAVVYDAATFRDAFQQMQDGRFITALEHPRAHDCRQVPAQPVPVIVPPSWDKTRYQNSLRPVWARAAQELAVADEIFVIGYSLPETDAFFRYLFALGTQSRTRIHRVLVVNPDKDIRQKFERFIGQGLRPQLQFAVGGAFEASLGEIETKLLET